MRLSINSINDLIEEEVQIYPNDTYAKYGKIIDINDNGILFLITRADKGAGSAYEVGSYRFISYSANLTFKY